MHFSSHNPEELELAGEGPSRQQALRAKVERERLLQCARELRGAGYVVTTTAVPQRRGPSGSEVRSALTMALLDSIFD